jgi:hypothetical protein
MVLKNGVDVKDVARMVGNSPEIIYRYFILNLAFDALYSDII